MAKNQVSEIITKTFGSEIYKKALSYPINKFNIIKVEDNPILVRAIVLENEREYHLIINEDNGQIFHDCPTFLVYEERMKRICVHFIKLLLLLKSELSLKILKNFDNYKLTSEDPNSEYKSNNYLLVANSCFSKNNSIEGLTFLSKAIINQNSCEDIINRYLTIAVKNGLFIEFFEFINNGVSNDLQNYFQEHLEFILKGFTKFLDQIRNYSFYNLLLIINSLSSLFEVIDISILKNYLGNIENMLKSENFNERYFSYFFIQKNRLELKGIWKHFEKVISSWDLKNFREELIGYFSDQIDNFSTLETLKLMKNQFPVFGIEKEGYFQKYKNYKNEIRDLEKKIYRKKFEFLKLLMENYDIEPTRGEFRKKRNIFIVKHDPDNLKNPAYQYIINHLGFYGINAEKINPADIGLNYFLIKSLFNDDFTKFPDIFYYRNQFWGETEDIDINANKGMSLLRNTMDFTNDTDLVNANLSDVLLIEWDLINKPKHCNIVHAYSSQIIIPDQNNPLFYDLKPFEICYCRRTPVKIEGNLIKTVDVISKCSFKDAIQSVKNGMEYIEGYYPLTLVESIVQRKLNPFKAYEILLNDNNRAFAPYFDKFLEDMKDFIFKFIQENKNFLFEELMKKSDFNVKEVFLLLNIQNEISGLDLPFTEIIKNLLKGETYALSDFKIKFIKTLHTHIQDILQGEKVGSTKIFNIKKMNHTSFFKYVEDIIELRRNEFENAPILKIKSGEYDISSLEKTYYGEKLLYLMNIRKKTIISETTFEKLSEHANAIELEINTKSL